MTSSVPESRVAAVREFNRTYTAIIGVLDESLLESPFSLAEARVLFELAQRDSTEVTALRRTLGLDAGYLSRLLGRLEGAGLLERARSSRDGRQQVAELTPAGRDAFGRLDERSDEQVRALLAGTTDDGQRRVVEAMAVIADRLGARGEPPAAVLRAPLPGELGWVVQRHGAFYAGEYGWDGEFEALTARVVADYLGEHDPHREAAWIAEVHGEPAGSVLCVREDDRGARLRLLLVEPSARGLGVGSRLVAECVRFARSAGYETLGLWTVDVLHAARRIYQRQGFQLLEEQRRRMFGHDLTGQTWRLRL